MNIPYVFKKCTKCGEWLVAYTGNFHKQNNGKYGLQSYCKKCRKEQRKEYYKKNIDKEKEYYQNNKEQKKEYKKKWHKKNRDRIKEHKKEYYENNKEYFKHYHKEYRLNNKDKIREQSKKYYKTLKGQVIAFNCRQKRRLREQTQGNGITTNQWLECMNFFNWKCAYSDNYIGGNENQNTRSLDHIIPLAKGGENEIWNLVPMYKPYNSSKQDKDLLEWYQEQDFYSEDRLQKIYEWQEYAYNKYHKEEIV